MIAFTADYVSGDITLNPAEIAEARWFSKNDELPLIAPSFSIAGSLIQAHLSC
jgi:NAD+ diphosphatase